MMYSADSASTHEEKRLQWIKVQPHEYEFIPQRTRMWFELRTHYPITGSTFCNLLLLGLSPGGQKYGAAQIPLIVEDHFKGEINLKVQGVIFCSNSSCSNFKPIFKFKTHAYGVTVMVL